MVHVVGLVRFSAALIFSGVFWATVLFLVNACALNRRVPFLGVGLAVGVLGLAADLFTKVVVGRDLLALLR
jgi:hypothetical protein